MARVGKLVSGGYRLGGVGGFSSGLDGRKMIGGSDLLCAGGHTQPPVEHPSGKLSF